MPPILLSWPSEVEWLKTFLCLHSPEWCAVANRSRSSVNLLNNLSDILAINIDDLSIAIHIVVYLFPSTGPASEDKRLCHSCKITQTWLPNQDIILWKGEHFCWPISIFPHAKYNKQWRSCCSETKIYLLDSQAENFFWHKTTKVKLTHWNTVVATSCNRGRMSSGGIGRWVKTH